MLNRVILMGRITAQPELKTTQSGTSVTTFSLAVDRGYVKQGEERKTDFINIVCWRNTAEFVCKYFSKGSLIALEGQLQTRSYQGNDGATRYVTEVLADNVSFTGEKRENSQPNYQPQQSYNQQPQPNYQPQQNYNQQPQQNYQQYGFEEVSAEDLPF